jgi:cellobiose phosphorylase
MGSGDWNDSMNRVGYQGRGESIWLALKRIKELMERLRTSDEKLKISWSNCGGAPHCKQRCTRYR